MVLPVLPTLFVLPANPPVVCQLDRALEARLNQLPPDKARAVHNLAEGCH